MPAPAPRPTQGAESARELTPERPSASAPPDRTHPLGDPVDPDEVALAIELHVSGRNIDAALERGADPIARNAEALPERIWGSAVADENSIPHFGNHVSTDHGSARHRTVPPISDAGRAALDEVTGDERTGGPGGNALRGEPDDAVADDAGMLALRVDPVSGVRDGAVSSSVGDHIARNRCETPLDHDAGVAGVVDAVIHDGPLVIGRVRRVHRDADVRDRIPDHLDVTSARAISRRDTVRSCDEAHTAERDPAD